MVDLQSFKQYLKPYTELRLHKNSTKNLSIVNGKITRNTSHEALGVSARAHINGYCGFAALSGINEENVKQVCEDAHTQAAFLASKDKEKHSDFIQREAKQNNYQHDDVFLSSEEMQQYLLKASEAMALKYPDLISKQLNHFMFKTEKELITSDDQHSKYMWFRSMIRVVLIKEHEKEPVEIDELIHTKELLNFDGFMRRIDELYQKLLKKCEGVVIASGVYDVILSSDLAGMLAHEAIGHTVEADFVRKGSVASTHLEKVVASPLVTLIDIANTFQDYEIPVPLHVDDEGTICKDLTIIDKGVLKNFIHDRSSAHSFSHESYGHARALAYDDEPLIRMRNTAIMPGEDDLDDMIKSIDFGYYFTKLSNGQADTTGEFMFGITEGYEIRHGKIVRAIRDTTIFGVAFDVLKSVTHVSKEFKWLSGGMCYKKQAIHVGMGGAAIKCKVKVGGC